ncbi:MAG: MarR family EPS-associated transcriptional regulator [Deltaproteobacteria bacterium]|nr:MarR family EPS-associated transcriptional regulator [Deltaproteobacteria bacterium]
MKHFYNQEIHYRLLNLLADEPRIGQRDMARKMGISIGKVNYCIAELAGKGLIKIKRFKNTKPKLPYAYRLTPHGMEEKGQITIKYLKRKLEEYDEIKRQIEALTQDVEQNGLQAMAEAELGDIKARLI